MTHVAGELQMVRGSSFRERAVTVGTRNEGIRRRWLARRRRVASVAALVDELDQPRRDRFEGQNFAHGPATYGARGHFPALGAAWVLRDGRAALRLDGE
jgi:hypothetical protein